MAPVTLYCESSPDSLMLEAKIGATELIEHIFRDSMNNRNSSSNEKIGETIQVVNIISRHTLQLLTITT